VKLYLYLAIQYAIFTDRYKIWDYASPTIKKAIPLF
jgi:hypothetical protein